MKAHSKYGSAYPAGAPGKKAKATTPSKASPSAAPPAAPINEATTRLPHERDESVDQGGGGVHSESVAQAGRDTQRGLPDTDRGIEMGKAYQKQKT